MITLHTFPGKDGLESVSPFCMKVEIYLKLAELPYKTASSNPLRAPKGKMPFIEQDDGPTVADSSAILDHLEKRSAKPFDENMSEDEIARARIVQRMLEEALYFVLLWTRWVDEIGWAGMKSIFDFIPGAVRWAVTPMLRKRVAGTLSAQGTGRHSRDEIYEMGRRDLHALSTFLGDRPYFTGAQLRTVDVTAFAFLANILKFETDNPLRAAAKSHGNLVAFVDRIDRQLKKKAPESASAQAS